MEKTFDITKWPERVSTKPNIVWKKEFLVNLIVLLVVKFDLSLISTIEVFTFTSFRKKILNIELISKFSYIPIGKVYAVVFVLISFKSNKKKNSRYLLIVT